MEVQLREAILKGEPLDFRTNEEKRDPTDGSDWGPERTLPAGLLTRLLGRDDWPHRPRGLLLGGARITGLFDLSALEVACPVALLLVLRGAKLQGAEGLALTADGLTVGHHLKGSRLRAEGEVWLRGARIGGVDLERLQVHKLDMRDLARPPDRLYLLNAKLSILTDDPRSWPRNLYLRDCTYDSLVEQPRIDARRRLQWLERDSFGYQPQPYEQLAAVYRRSGRHQDARTVAIASQRARRRTLPLPGKLANVLLDAFVGYGYRTWLAGVWLLGLVLAGWVAFDLAHPASLVAPLPPGERPLFHAGLYSLDLLLPVGDLDYQGAWIARGWARGLWLGWILAGWVLTTAVLAALASILKRD